MPRGRPKRIVVVRLDPEMFEEVRLYSPNVTRAVEQALTAWLKRERRKPAKGAPPPAPETAAQRKV